MSAHRRPSRPVGSLWRDGAAYVVVAFRDTIFGTWEIYASARKHGIVDEDIVHAVEHALAIGEQDDGKVLYLGPDRGANMLEVVSVLCDDGCGEGGSDV